MAVTPTWSTSKGTVRNSEAVIRDNAETIATELSRANKVGSVDWTVAVGTLEQAALAGHITFTRTN